jgi:hypothetical protein
MKNLKFTIITFYQFKKNNEYNKFRIILDQFCSFHKNGKVWKLFRIRNNTGKYKRMDKTNFGDGL